MIGKKWWVGKGGDGVMSIRGNDGECWEVDGEDEFYGEKKIFGKGDIEVFIRGLFWYKVVDGKVKGMG